MDVQAVDVDLLPTGRTISGPARTPEEFADDYKRHKISVPIHSVERDGKPGWEMDDPVVAKAIEEYRQKKTEFKKSRHLNPSRNPEVLVNTAGVIVNSAGATQTHSDK